MHFLAVLYFIVFPLVAIISVMGTVIYRRNRLKKLINEPPFDFQKTNEVFIDPTTGIKQQVWFNPNSGERFYQNIDEKKKIEDE
ncbi:hypothetical protein SAMN03159341_104148 [Paenibacillus sp. 1_12]|uniref:hypothetical protein n=1 Tax=Paenibacillus sp. 1_12 TaxID=1566278 RepID=UPI0008EC11A9|nr:hypothetical protein [Paenibacillus sp. 1_12]SFL23166.1 hypothetical protein SAMN03159341_104148 [Paenibacillus sp. 1_12]